jgi:hypothetical protein
MGKVVLDQALAPPIIVMSVFTLNGKLQGHSVEEIKDHVSSSYTDVLFNSYKVNARLFQLLTVIIKLEDVN